jgi:cytochrome c-type biogenesis protein CcmH
VPIASIALYVLLGHPEGTNPLAQRQVTAQDIERMVATLAAKMEKEPGNVQGWGMLARSYKAMGRVDEATKAFEHLLTLNPADAQIYADYADILAMKANGNFAGKPQQLIDQALKLDPNNAEALWLAGTAAFEDGRYQQAIPLWTRLQGMLPP